MTETPISRQMAQRIARLAQVSREASSSPEGRVRTRQRIAEAKQNHYVDMSERAIDSRINELCALYKLCSSLADCNLD